MSHLAKIAFILAIFSTGASCNRSDTDAQNNLRPGPSDVESQEDRKTTDPTTSAAPQTPPAAGVDSKHHFERFELNDEELTMYEETWEYSGGPITCWLEINKDGKMLVSEEPPFYTLNEADLKAFFSESTKGSVRLWWTPGEMHFRLVDIFKLERGVVTSSRSYFKGYTKEGLWWGWKGQTRATCSKRIGVVTPHTGEEFVLFRCKFYDNIASRADANNSRRVEITLKGKFIKYPEDVGSRDYKGKFRKYKMQPNEPDAGDGK